MNAKAPTEHKSYGSRLQLAWEQVGAGQRPMGPLAHRCSYCTRREVQGSNPIRVDRLRLQASLSITQLQSCNEL